MNTIKLDFRHCYQFDDLHTVLKETFSFPDFYGRNWSALWDHGCDYIVGPVRIEVYGLTDLPKDWQGQIDIMKQVFADIHEEWPDIEFVYMDKAK